MSLLSQDTATPPPTLVKVKKTSLTRQTLLKTALIIIGATVLSSTLSYFYLFSSLQTQFSAQLDKYITERVARERTTFSLVQDNQNLLKEQLVRLSQEQATGVTDTAINAEFDRLFVKMDDGVIRNRPEQFDGTHQTGVYIGIKAIPDVALKRRMLLYYHLVDSFGPAWHSRFQDTYIATPDNLLAVYWPEYPTWAQDAKADYDMTKEEWFYVADSAHNPTRKLAWTGAYFDTVSKNWLISSETPVDFEGRHIANIGQDITLNQLVDRTIQDHIDNAYNLILRQDGRLIAHPQLMDAIQQGKSEISQLNDPHLQRIYDLIKANLDPGTGKLKKTVLDNPQDNEYLALGQLEGPDWLFVSVVSKTALATTAGETARFIILLGGLALLVELVVLWLILKGQIARPLNDLTAATKRIAAGDLNIALDGSRRDELGQLAASFNAMTAAVAERELRLTNVGEAVRMRATELKVTADQQAVGSRQQASAVTQVNSSINELNSTASNISRLAYQVKESARQMAGASQLIYETTSQAVLQSEDGREAVGRTLAVSLETTSFYLELLAQMKELESRSANMRHILDLIGAIAGETHLLSLNAAIEAAGAGQQGERFRVVAQEVKSLAERSNKASREVVEIVRQIESVTGGVLNSVEEGYTKALELTSIAEQAGAVIEGLREVAEQAEQQAHSISKAAENSLALGEQIEISTHQQSSAGQQVLEVLSGLSITAQQNAQGSSLVSTTAGELEEVSRHLSTALAV